jgi:hypothetical protein
LAKGQTLPSIKRENVTVLQLAVPECGAFASWELPERIIPVLSRFATDHGQNRDRAGVHRCSELTGVERSIQSSQEAPNPWRVVTLYNTLTANVLQVSLF